MNPLRRHVVCERPAPSVDQDTTGGTSDVGSDARPSSRRSTAMSVGAVAVLVACDGRIAPRTPPMRLLHPDPGHDLTYNDVFMVPEPVGRGVPPRRRPHDARRHRHAPSPSSSPT